MTGSRRLLTIGAMALSRECWIAGHCVFDVAALAFTLCKSFLCHFDFSILVVWEPEILTAMGDQSYG